MTRELGTLALLLVSHASPMRDPVATDGDRYRVLLENERVRVLAYTDRPGDRTHEHHHPAFVLYALGVNIGDTPTRVIIVELKEPVAQPASPEERARTADRVNGPRGRTVGEGKLAGRVPSRGRGAGVTPAATSVWQSPRAQRAVLRSASCGSRRRHERECPSELPRSLVEGD